MSLAERELDAAIKAAKLAGGYILKNHSSKKKVIRKSLNEMVTESDIKSQSIIKDSLSKSFPEYDIISEEEETKEITRGNFWIIDPIDGTHNFISGLPFYGVSIGLLRNFEFVLGVIFFPSEKKLFSAIRNGGAFCNDQKLRVSDNKNLGSAIVTYDNQFYLESNSFENYKKLVDKAFTTRILGSAARDICFISEGITDARIWNNTKICDIAAGIVIHEEAGGLITDFAGQNVTVNSRNVIASNSKFHQELISLFR